MKKRIYLHLFLVGLVCILVTALVCAFASWQTTKRQTLYDLQQTAQVLGTEMDAHYDPDRIVRRAASASHDLRFTWIARNGKVLYDPLKMRTICPTTRIVRKWLPPSGKARARMPVTPPPWGK